MYDSHKHHLLKKLKPKFQRLADQFNSKAENIKILVTNKGYKIVKKEGE